MDLKDKKLLTYLDRNSRISINNLSKLLYLSNNSIKNRINNLIKEDIIERFVTIIDIGKLGYIPIRIFLKLTHTSISQEKELIDYLINTGRIGWIVSVEGHWDINTYFTFKSLEEFHHFYEELMTTFRAFIQETNISFYRKVINYSREYLLDEDVKEKRVIVDTKNNVVQLKPEDITILKLLSSDSRIPIIDMASKTGLTSKTIINKIKLFEKEEIITGYRVQLNLEKISYEYHKIHITLSKSTIDQRKILKLKEYLSSRKEVIIEDVMTGGFDIEVEVEIQSGNKIHVFIDELKECFSELIADIEILKYYKQHYEKLFPE